MNDELLVTKDDRGFGDVRILFADDAEDITQAFRDLINKHGWNGLYVTNAVELMDTINNLMVSGLHLDAIVSVITFFSGPKVTGITAAREIRKVMPDVPIVFISQYITSSMMREEVRRVGNSEIIAKPFDADVLFSRLSHLIAWHRTVTWSKFEGPDRRRTSTNRTNNLRRITDRVLSTPKRISDSLKGLGDKI